jgi:hypothetical protein
LRVAFGRSGGSAAARARARDRARDRNAYTGVRCRQPTLACHSPQSPACFSPVAFPPNPSSLATGEMVQP